MVGPQWARVGRRPTAWVEGRTLNCRKALKALPETLDGGGSAELRAAVEEHVAACPACRREHDALRRSWELLDAVQAPPASERFSAAVMSRVRAGSAAPQPAAAGPVHRRWWPAPAMVMGLVALLAVSALLTHPRQTPGPGPAPSAPAAAPSALARALTDDEIIRDLDVYEQLDLLDNLSLLADLDVLEDSEVEL